MIRDTQYEDGSGNTHEAPAQPGPELPDFDVIVGAPDLAALIKRPQSAAAREYTKKIGAALKAVAVGAIHSGNFPDAATVLWHGPGAATALGTLCDENDRVAQAVDMLTSPSNPWTAFFLASIPLVTQMFRNHEAELQELPKRWNMSREARVQRKSFKTQAEKPEPRFTIKIGKRRFPVRFKVRMPFVRTFVGGVRSQTQEPNVIAARVFMDPDVRKALEKLGIQLREAEQ